MLRWPAAAQPVAAADVRAYALNPASVQLLQSLKVWDALPLDARTAVQDMHVEGDNPGAVIDFSAWSMGLEALAWIVDAAELENALRAAVRFAPHIAQTGADAADTGAACKCWPRAAVRRRASSSASRCRAMTTASAPWLRGWSARKRMPAWRGNGSAAPTCWRCCHWTGPPSEGRSGHGLALVWSLPEAEAERLLALPDDDFTAVLMDATAGAAGPLSLVGQRASWPLAMARAERLYGPGWVLVGDAAHVVHPLAGQGLNLGFADVAALAAVVAERNAREAWRPLSDPRLLAGYARQRQGPTRAMAQATDGLLQLFASEQPLLKELRNGGLTLVNSLPPLKRFLSGRAMGV